MKSALSLVAGTAAVASEVQTNPMSTVINLMDELTAKVMKDGEAEAKAYAEYVEWCDDTAKNTNFAIEDGTKQVDKLEAKIAELTSDSEVAGTKIEEHAAAIASIEKELKDAATVREKESADFEASEKELTDALSALSRAVGILEKEMAKNPASFAQMDTSSLFSTIQALGAVLDAAAFSSIDQQKLVALAQTQDDDEGPGAPAAATYKTHSTDILDVLTEMKEKAESQLSELRKDETKTRQNYEMLKQSLEAQLAADKKGKGEQAAAKAAADEEKSASEGDLSETSKSLAASKEQLATTQSTCLEVAADHERSVAGRKEELGVIAQAKKILTDTSSGAVSQTYSFLQSGSMRLHSHADLVGSEVAAAVKALAKRQHSSALAQLASRIAAVARYGASNGADPFAKITGLIRDMIAKLENEANAEAEEKAYCDEQIAKTEFKKGELEDDIAKATSKIDRAAARSAKLKSEIKTLEGELGALAKDQAEMDQIRSETHADFETAKADLELGLTGVRKALRVLRDYYASGDSMLQQPAKPEVHDKSSGAGGGIIDILEVCESDFAKNLAQEEAAEADAQAEYEKVSQENAVTKTTKEQDVKYKGQEAKSMDETVVEYSGDRDAANNELSAVLEYYAKIKERCIAKPETYEERKRRREAEIEGLKQALTILKEETALVQRKHRSFRGSLAA